MENKADENQNRLNQLEKELKQQELQFSTQIEEIKKQRQIEINQYEEAIQHLKETLLELSQIDVNQEMEDLLQTKEQELKILNDQNEEKKKKIEQFEKIILEYKKKLNEQQNIINLKKTQENEVKELKNRILKLEKVKMTKSIYNGIKSLKERYNESINEINILRAEIAANKRKRTASTLDDVNTKETPPTAYSVNQIKNSKIPKLSDRESDSLDTEFLKEISMKSCIPQINSIVEDDIDPKSSEEDINHCKTQ